MLEVIDALRKLFEPDVEATDTSGEMPFDWQPGILYVFEDESSIALWDAGETYREDFAIMAVYPVAAGEEARQARDRDVTVKLDDRRRLILATVANNPSMPSTDPATPLWSYITASSQPRYLREFDLRGIAVRIVGYRLITITEGD